MSYASTLMRYKAWADDVFLSVVSALPAIELTAPRTIFFGSLIRTLNHSYTMDYVWQSHLLGNPHGLQSRNPQQCPDINELTATQQDIDRWYVEYSNTLTDGELSQHVEFEFIGGGRGVMSRSEILLHVVNHGTYHRGQAADIVYNCNVVPPVTDLSVFLRDFSVVT